MLPPLALIGGYIDRLEFQDAFRSIADLLEKHQWESQKSSTIPTQPCREPSLIILFQSYPEQFSSTKLNEYRKFAPLTPVLLFSDANSEGSQRTSRFLKGLFSFYVYQFNDNILSELECYISGNKSVFDFPATTEEDDFILQCSTVAFSDNTILSGQNCHILRYYGPFGNDSSMNQFLADYCRQRGAIVCQTHEMVDSSFNGIILADSDDSKIHQITEAIQRLRMNYADAKINVYMNSPRIDEKLVFLNAGANCILPKFVYW